MRTLITRGVVIVFSFLIFTSCAENASNDSVSTDSTSAAMGDKPADLADLEPKGPKPDWAPEMEDAMTVVIEKLQSYGDKPLETISAQEARQQHTPTDAVMDVMKENNIPMPAPSVDTIGKNIPVQGGKVHARIYTPRGNDSSYPVIVYYHGGGWVIADLNTYDASARGIAEQTNAIVVSVHYRQGPEHKFPTAHNDAFAAYQWVVKNAAFIKGDPKRIAVAGESAGGNLACNVSILARDKGFQLPVFQLLIYPVANNDMNSESYQKFAAAKPLNKPMMEWFAKNYLPDTATAADPRISLVRANLKGLPSTMIVAAEIDPLTTEGKMLADKLKEAGVDVYYKLYEGVTHEFFGMATVLPEAREAQIAATDELRGAFNKQ